MVRSGRFRRWLGMLVAVFVFSSWLGLSTPSIIYADTINDIKFPFGNCQTWYVWQGYSSGSHSDANRSRYAFDLVKDKDDAVISGGLPITSPVNGIVSWIDPNPYGGDDVGIKLNDDTVVILAHLMNIEVTRNQNVAVGSPIGQVSTSEPGGVNHLHFDVRVNNVSVPLDFGVWNYPASGVPGNTYSNGVWSGTAISSPCAPPSGTISTPASNTTVSGVVKMTGQVTANNSTISRIEIYFGDTIEAVVTPSGSNWEWYWTTTNRTNRSYAIKAKAIDASGQSAWLKASNGSEVLNVTSSNPTTLFPPASSCLKPLLRYWSQNRLKHFYTFNSAEGVIISNSQEWVYEGHIGYVAMTASCHMPNAIPLYRFWSASRNKHFYTTNRAEGLAAGFQEQGVEGFVATTANSQYNTKSVKRFYRQSIDNHFYTSNMAEIPSDYNDEGIKFYVFDLVNRAPNKPTLNAPTHNSATVNKTLALMWSDAGDPDNYPRAYRDYQVSIRKVGGTWTNGSGWIPATSWSVTVPETGQYCWKVQSGDGQSMSGWATERCLTVYPTSKITVDNPVANKTITKGFPYQINGWSLQLETPSGTGIDKIHIYLDGPAGSGQLVGVATYGVARSGVAATYGERYRNSGFVYDWDTKNVSVGQHTLYIYANSTVTGWSSMTRTVNIVAPKKVFVPLLRK